MTLLGILADKRNRFLELFDSIILGLDIHDICEPSGT
jgi:hypothetical protein